MPLMTMLALFPEGIPSMALEMERVPPAFTVTPAENLV